MRFVNVVLTVVANDWVAPAMVMTSMSFKSAEAFAVSVPFLMSFSKTTDAVRRGIASVSPSKPDGNEVTTLLRDVVAAEIVLIAARMASPSARTVERRKEKARGLIEKRILWTLVES